MRNVTARVSMARRIRRRTETFLLDVEGMAFYDSRPKVNKFQCSTINGGEEASEELSGSSWKVGLGLGLGLLK